MQSDGYIDQIITRGYHRPAFVGIEWGYDDTYWELNAGVDMYYRGIINDG